MAFEIKENIPLAPYTIYKIGGAARFFAEVKNADELEEAVRFAAEKSVPFFVMGAGSNILVADTGFQGMIIRMTDGTIRAEEEKMTVDAGVAMARAAAESARAGLAGFAWAVGVPGTIGGSVRGNAGCFGREMKDVVDSVMIFDTVKKATCRMSHVACHFAYRDSIFKRHPEWIVISATLALAPGNSILIQEEIRRTSSERAAKQDIGSKSCGCVFKNPSWNEVQVAKEALIVHFPELAEFARQDRIPAAFLIDRTGLKGMRAGYIVISQKHGNFFLNEGGGTAEDVVKLAAMAQDAVFKKYGIRLTEEIQRVGF